MKAAAFAGALALSLAFGMAQAQDKAASKGGGPSDAEIAGIVVAANQIDIDAGKLAKTRTQDKEVEKFAEQMVTDHTAVNKQAADLVKKLGVKPRDSETSKSLKSAASKTEAKLKTLKGGEFDKAYVENEVAFHQQVLDAIDKTLLPNAKNAELKDLIAKVRPVIAAHLDHAKMISTSLSKK